MGAKQRLMEEEDMSEEEVKRQQDNDEWYKQKQMLKKKDLQRFNTNIIKQNEEDQRYEKYTEDVNEQRTRQQPKVLPASSLISRAQPNKQLFNKNASQMLDKKNVAGPKPLVNGKVQDDTKYLPQNSFAHLRKPNADTAATGSMFSSSAAFLKPPAGQIGSTRKSHVPSNNMQQLMKPSGPQAGTSAGGLPLKNFKPYTFQQASKKK